MNCELIGKRHNFIPKIITDKKQLAQLQARGPVLVHRCKKCGEYRAK